MTLDWLTTFDAEPLLRGEKRVQKLKQARRIIRKMTPVHSRSYYQKFDEDDAAEMRQMWSDHTMKDITQKFNCSEGVARSIIRNKSHYSREYAEFLQNNPDYLVKRIAGKPNAETKKSSKKIKKRYASKMAVRRTEQV